MSSKRQKRKRAEKSAFGWVRVPLSSIFLSSFLVVVVVVANRRPPLTQARLRGGRVTPHGSSMIGEPQLLLCFLAATFFFRRLHPLVFLVLLSTHKQKGYVLSHGAHRGPLVVSPSCVVAPFGLVATRPSPLSPKRPKMLVPPQSSRSAMLSPPKPSSSIYWKQILSWCGGTQPTARPCCLPPCLLLDRRVAYMYSDVSMVSGSSGILHSNLLVA